MALLGWILGILKTALGFAVGWIKGGRVFIVAGVLAWVGLVVWANSQLGNVYQFTTSVLDTIKDQIAEFMSWLSSLPFFVLIYRAFALDVLMQCLVQQWSVVIVFLVFVLASSIISGMAMFAPLMIWRVMSKLLTSTTGGMIKT